ncbi:PQQ-like beta-propeller repeat protein [bacterium]|nr:PQQ-like beta-propeller repeat protein [bacterium]
MSIVSIVLLSFFMAAPEGSADRPIWSQFRGPTGSGESSSPELPAIWNEETNIAWKTPVPGSGWSQPVVVNGKVFVTSAVSPDGGKPMKMTEGSSDRRSMFGDSKPPETIFRWELHCYDLETGKPLWTNKLAEQKSGLPTHPSNTFATETAAVDAKRVYAYFGSIGKLFCTDHDGKTEWEADLGVYKMTSGLGTGSSPIVVGDKVVVQCYNEENSFLVALDGANGKEVWRAKRANGTSWSTPYLWQRSDRTELIACGKSRVYAYNPADGSIYWEMGGIVGGFAATPVANKDYLFLGNNGPLSPAPLLAVKAGANGDITPPKGVKTTDQIPWSRLKSGPGLSSPVVLGEELYTSNDSFLNCYDIKTGERIYRERLPEARNIVASPLVWDGKLYILDEEGRTFIVRGGRSFDLVGTNKLEDTFWASPAIAGDRLLLRGVEKLYCVKGSP